MTSPYLPPPRILPEASDRTEDEHVSYWKRLKQLSVFQEPGTVSAAEFSPVKPYNLASTASVRLSLYDTVVCEPINLFSRFKQGVYGVKFRSDGQLVVIGGEEGKVRVFDVDRHTAGNKVPLRSVKASPGAVHSAFFSASSKTFFSLADDGIVKEWDLTDTGSRALSSLDAHSDACRVGCASATNPHLLVTGGYDHKVKVWDVRTGSDGPSICVEAGAPVESLVLFPNEHLLAVAAGPVVKIVDLTAGGRVLSSMQLHHKTVTSMCLAQGGRAFLTAAIDKRCNVHKVADFSLVHSFSLPAPVLSVSCSGDDQSVAFGMPNLLALWRRAAPPAKVTQIEKGARDKMERVAAPKVLVAEKAGATTVKDKVELAAKVADRVHLSKYDQLLQRFQNAAALRKIFNDYRFLHTAQVVGWMRVLLHRKEMQRAVNGVGEKTHILMLRFIRQNIFKTAYFETLTASLDCIFKALNADPSVPPSQAVMRQIHLTKKSVAVELTIQKQIAQSIGVLELIIHSAAKPGTSQEDEGNDIFGEPIISAVALDMNEEEKKGEGEKMEV